MWKDTIKKKDEEDGSTGRRSYTNKVRDTRSAESYKTGDSHRETTLTDETKEAFAKIEEEIRVAFESVDFNPLMSVIMPHGRTKGTYKDKEELVSAMVKDAINRLKSNRLYE